MKKLIVVAIIMAGIITAGYLFFSRQNTKPIQVTNEPASFVDQYAGQVYFFEGKSLKSFEAASGKTTTLIDGIDLTIDNVVWSPDKSKVILNIFNDHGSDFVNLPETPFNSRGNVLIDLNTKNSRELNPEARQIKWVDNNNIIFKVIDEEYGGAVLYTSSIYDFSEPHILGSVSEEDAYLPVGNKIFVAKRSTDVSKVSVRAIDMTDNLIRQVGIYENFRGFDSAGEYLIIKHETFDFFNSRTLLQTSRLSTSDLVSAGEGKVYVLSQGERTLYEYKLPDGQKVIVKTFEELPRAVSFSVENSILILDTGAGLTRLKF